MIVISSRLCVCFLHQVIMQDGPVSSVALSSPRSLNWRCAISSARAAGGAGSPWQVLRPWRPPCPPAPSPAKRTPDPWMRFTPPSRKTPSSTCWTPGHWRSWPTWSCWEAASLSTSWSTGVKTDPLKHWRVWSMFLCWSTRVQWLCSTPSSAPWRRRRKWGFSWPSSSGQRLTGPGWRWGSDPVFNESVLKNVWPVYNTTVLEGSNSSAYNCIMENSITG